MRPSKIVRTCKNCGAEFKVQPNVVKRGSGNYCSFECRKNLIGEISKGRAKSNTFEHKNAHSEIIILKGDIRHAVLFDKVDFDLIKNHYWFIDHSGYVRSTDDYLLHRLLMNTPKGMHTDHINRDKLDNRKSNLRICTASQNMMNGTSSRVRHGATRTMYKGVSKQSNCKSYRAALQIKGKQIYIGSFKTQEEAAKAYDTKAKELFGEFARTNF